MTYEIIGNIDRHPALLKHDNGYSVIHKDCKRYYIVDIKGNKVISDKIEELIDFPGLVSFQLKEDAIIELMSFM